MADLYHRHNFLYVCVFVMIHFILAIQFEHIIPRKRAPSPPFQQTREGYPPPPQHYSHFEPPTQRGLIRPHKVNFQFLIPARIQIQLSPLNILLLPRTHAQGVKQSVLSVVGTKIARSRDLGISATRNHNESVEIGEKLASVCFNYFGTAHERHKQSFFIGHAYRPRLLRLLHAGHVLSAHAHNSPGIRR